MLAVPGEITSGALERDEPPAAARRDAGHVRRRRSGGDRRPRRLPPRPPRAWTTRLERVRVVIADAPASVDEIVRRTGLDAASVAAAIAELELLGVIAQAEGRYREVMPPT